MHFHHDVPEPLMESFKRVVFKAPESLRENSHFQLMTFLHLKVGGERLASQNTELFKLMLEEERIFNRWLIREGGTDGNDTADTDEISESEDEADADDDAMESSLEGEDDFSDDSDDDDLADEADF